MLEYVQKHSEIRERFIGYAFQNDPTIKDVGDFQDALFSAFNTTVGKNASMRFNDDVIMELFDSQECKDKISMNLSNDEFQKIYGEGVKTQLPSQEPTIVQPKQVKVNNYTRNGQTIKAYNRSYRGWTKAEAKFIKVRKARKLTTGQIISDFNKNFNENQRSESSIRTKIHRL